MHLLGLGDNTVDTYVDRAEQYPGGNAINVAVLAGRLGIQAGYCGCLGDDEAGEILRAALSAEKIDTSHCRFRRAPNARAFIAHNDGDRRFIRSEPGCRADWGGFSDEDERYIAGFDMVHSSIFSGLDPFVGQLRGVIRRWSFDFSEKWNSENLAGWLPSLDHAFLSGPQMNDEEAQGLAQYCASFGPSTVVITRGARAALVWERGRSAWQQPEKITVVDTLGAGDGLIAAFLTGLMCGFSGQQALANGLKNASDVCTRFGAFGYGRVWRSEARPALQ